MRKDSIVIFSVSALITVAIGGGVYYMAVVRTMESPQLPTTWETLKPTEPMPTGNANVSAGTSNRRTNTPIKCHDPEIGEFWTNAANCGEADLHNRISQAQSITTPAQRTDYGNEDYVSPQEEAERNRGKTRTVSHSSAQKPSLRLNEKSLPSGLSAECKSPVGKALELERPLNVADDPRESIWREDYCGWLTEVWEMGCELSDDLFYYKNLCP